MKNKSKLNKIKQGKTNVSKLPAGWFLMSKSEVTVADIKSAAGDGVDCHYWIELGVAEISLGEKESIDIEQIDCDLGDEYSNSFIANKSVKTVFYLTFKPECYDRAKTVLKKIANELNGFVCADSENFEPYL